MEPLTYESAGVNVVLGDRFVDRIKQLAGRPGHRRMLPAAGGYAAVYEMTTDRYLALTTDGVGTKVLLAHQLGQHHGIGIDLVAMCANDLICVGARPTLFLDYFATGRLELETGTALIEGILDGCDQAGMILVGGETAEMPDVYAPGHYDLAGFAVGEVSPDQLLTGESVRPGQKVIALAASGVHSNGLSLARKCLHDPADLTALLTPTRIYVQPILDTFARFSGQVAGLAHITGGGWRNLFRLNPSVGFEFFALPSRPPVFEKLLAAGVSMEEAFKTFNMGMGLALIVSGDAGAIARSLQQGGWDAAVIGEVTDASGRLTIPELKLSLTKDK